MWGGSSTLRIDQRRSLAELAALVDEKSPVRSALSFELSTRRQGLGALTLTSTSVDGFSDADVERGYALAAHAALAVDAAAATSSSGTRWPRAT